MSNIQNIDNLEHSETVWVAVGAATYSEYWRQYLAHCTSSAATLDWTIFNALSP